MTSDAENTRTVRALGGVERTFYWMNRNDVQLPMGCARIDGLLPVESVQAAARWLWRSHAPLRATIVEGAAKDTLHFNEGAPCPEAQHAKEVTSDFPQIAAESMHLGFDTVRGPLWRPIVVHHEDTQASTLVVVMHHAIEDGATILYMLSALMERAREHSAGEALPELAGRSFVEGADTIAALKPSFWDFFKGVGLVLSHIFLPGKLVLDEPAVSLDGRRAHVITRDLSPESTRQLLGRCRGEGVTFNAILTASVLQQTAEAIRPDGPTRLLHETSVDIRSSAEPQIPPEQIGAYFSAIQCKLKIDPRASVWTLAHTVAAVIRAKVTGAEHLKALDLAKLIDRKAIQSILDAPHSRIQTTYVSNLGLYRMGGDEASTYPITHIRLACGIHGMGACIWCAAVTVAGRLNLTFVYPYPIVSDESAQRITDGIIAQLEKEAGGGLLTS